jgi:hypothetical protein
MIRLQDPEFHKIGTHGKDEDINEERHTTPVESWL